MKKILILEDNLVELENTAVEMREAGYEVFEASSTAEADDLLEQKKPFDCLIIDLNISNKFLDNDLIPKTHGGSLTGWVWLYNVAKPEFENSPMIIVYSEFIREIEENMESASDEEREYFKNVSTISKAAAVYDSGLLLQTILQQRTR